jgi:hypothetical protein
MARLEVRRVAGALKEEVADWCEGRSWIWRAPLLLYLAYIGVRHLADPQYSSLFGGINLGIHELGHVVLSFAGQWVMVLGGTLFQLAAPIVAAFLFLRQPDYFALPVCGAWFSTNLYSVATYMADARALELPLVTVGAEGGDVEHDWNYLLHSVGLLNYDTTLAVFVRLLALLLMWSSLTAGAWMCWRMARPRR